MTVKEAIEKRRSIRSYTGISETAEQLEAILTAAYLSPVGRGNYQGMHLTVIKDDELLDEIDKNAAEMMGHPDMHPLYKAPTLIIVSGKIEGNENVMSANAGMIIHNMSLTAVALGLGHCDIYGAIRCLNKNEALLKKMDIPEDYTALGSIIIGETNEEYKVRENRKTISTDIKK